MSSPFIPPMVYICISLTYLITHLSKALQEHGASTIIMMFSWKDAIDWMLISVWIAPFQVFGIVATLSFFNVLPHSQRNSGSQSKSPVGSWLPICYRIGWVNRSRKSVGGCQKFSILHHLSRWFTRHMAWSSYWLAPKTLQLHWQGIYISYLCPVISLRHRCVLVKI